MSINEKSKKFAGMIQSKSLALGLFILLSLLAPKSLALGFQDIDGFIDSVMDIGDKVRVGGWACQRSVNQSIAVDFYLGGPAGQGKMVARVAASIPNELAVNERCSTNGVSHRFALELRKEDLLPYRNQKIYAYGISTIPGKTNDPLTHSGEFLIPQFLDNGILGNFEAAYESGDNIVAVGWACQKNISQSIAVHVYAGGAAGAGGTYVWQAMADVENEPAVNQVCMTSGSRHRFVISMPKSRLSAFVGQELFIHGIATQSAWSNLAINRQSNIKVPPFSINKKLSELPKDPNKITVPRGMNVEIDQSLTTQVLDIQGRLSCPATGNFTFNVQAVEVTGEFRCGSEANPFAGKLSVRVYRGTDLVVSMNHGDHMMQHSVGERAIAAHSGGGIFLYGQKANSGWLHLSQTAAAGTRILNLSKPVNWQVGDRIAIAPSDYFYQEAEEVFIAQVISSTQVSLKTALKYTHYGFDKTYSNGTTSWTLQSRAEVANLTRNILIATGDVVGETNPNNPDHYMGAHMMIMAGSKGQIDSVEFEKMGQMGHMARYPFHWHLLGNAPGQYIRNSSIHHSFQRCIVVHGTNQVQVENNVCFEHRGHGIFLENGSEVNNLISGNLVMKSLAVPKSRGLLASDYPNTSLQVRRFAAGSSYWISNPRNTVVGNVSAGAEGTGFWMAFEPIKICNPDNCSVPNLENTLVFNDNTAKAAEVGMTWDGAPGSVSANNPLNADDRLLESTYYTPPGVPVFQNLQAYKNRYTGLYTRSDTMVFNRVVTADNTWHHFHAYNIKLNNALLVGWGPYQTRAGRAELGWRSNSGHYGVIIYDGPFELNGVHFADFSQSREFVTSSSSAEITAYPFGSIGGFERFPNRVRGLSFSPDPLKSVDFAEYTNSWADWRVATSIHDLDGSLVGQADVILVPNHIFNYKLGCVSETKIGALVCPAQDYPLGNLGVYDVSGINTANFFFFNTIRNNSAKVFINDRIMPSDRILHNKVNLILDGIQSYQVDVFGANMNNKLLNFQASVMGQASPIVRFINVGGNCSVEGAVRVGSERDMENSLTSSYLTQGSSLLVRLLTNQRNAKMKEELKVYNTYNRINCN